MQQFTVTQIGIINSPFKTKSECPVQGCAASKAVGTIEIFKEYQEGLLSIDLFSHIYLFYIFDQAGEVQLSRKPFLDDTVHGLFATRHPCRPSGLGMSVVKLNSRKDNILHVSEIDVLDQTPVIDIKPYVPKFDWRENASNGWVASVPFREKPENRE